MAIFASGEVQNARCCEQRMRPPAEHAATRAVPGMQGSVRSASVGMRGDKSGWCNRTASWCCSEERSTLLGHVRVSVERMSARRNRPVDKGDRSFRTFRCNVPVARCRESPTEMDKPRRAKRQSVAADCRLIRGETTQRTVATVSAPQATYSTDCRNSMGE